MAQAVPERDRPIVESILTRIGDHPDVVRWNKNLEVVLDGVTYPRSNILDLLRFIMKKQLIENNKGAPFGGKEFVDALIKIKIPRDWIQVVFQRKSKRKRAGIYSVGTDEDDYEDDDDDGDVVRPFKKQFKQVGSGIPWIIY